MGLKNADLPEQKCLFLLKQKQVSTMNGKLGITKKSETSNPLLSKLSSSQTSLGFEVYPVFCLPVKKGKCFPTNGVKQKTWGLYREAGFLAHLENFAGPKLAVFESDLKGILQKAQDVDLAFKVLGSNPAKHLWDVPEEVCRGLCRQNPIWIMVD